MNDSEYVERLRKLELRLAHLKGAAVVGLAAIAVYMGLTSWKTIPAAVEQGVRERIGDETLSKLSEAEAAAEKVLRTSEMQDLMQTLHTELGRNSESDKALEDRLSRITFSDILRGKERQAATLGSHLFCTLSSVATLHYQQKCICSVSREESDQWTLSIAGDENVVGECACRAICMG